MTTRWLSGVLLLLALETGAADWTTDPADRLETRAASAVGRIRERLPQSRAYFDQAYGYAVFPSVTRLGLGFGGAAGKGVVIEAGRVVGRTRYRQFTSGIQAGARNFSMIVFFEDEAALEYYKTGELQFLGQAGLSVGTAGLSSTPAYDQGVAILTLGRFGLMAEFTVSGAHYSFEALPDETGTTNPQEPVSPD